MHREQGAVGAKWKGRWNAQHLLGRGEAECLDPPQICRYLGNRDTRRVCLLLFASGVSGSQSAGFRCIDDLSSQFASAIHVVLECWHF